MIIPAGIAMPAMFMLPDSEALLSACAEWQSEFIEANAQERSQAAPSEDADNSSARIEPAKMRLSIILICIVGESGSAFQLQES